MSPEIRPHDAHVHLERLPDGSTNAALLVEAMDAVGVDTAAAVVPQPLRWDNSPAFEAAEAHPGRFVVILKVDVLAADAGAVASDGFDRGARGVRFTIFNDSDIGWLLDGTIDPVLAAFEAHDASLSFHCRPDQLPAVGELAAAHPGLTVFIDHLGRPDLDTGPDSPGFAGFLDLARLPNVLAKTPDSAFFSREAAPHLDLVPFLERAIGAFGAERVLWGSDWPIADYAMSLEPVLTLLAGATESERDAVLRGNFERVFRP